MIEDSASSCLRSKALLDEAPLRLPGFSMGREQALAEEVAHPLYLNLRLLVVFRIGLQHMLNDSGIDGNDRLLDATQIEAECIAEGLVVLRQNLHGIAGHGGRIRKGAQAGDNRDRRGEVIPSRPHARLEAQESSYDG
jgi:hypothetical protein